MKDILKALHERPIAYYPIYKKITGSTTAGILLSQLMYWWAKVDGRSFYKTDADIYEETALTERELKTAKAHLRQFDFVRIFLAGNPARTHYEISEDKLIEAIRQTSLDESAKQDRTKQPNKSGRNGQTLIQENTQKTKTVESAPAEFLVTTIALETLPNESGEVPRPAARPTSKVSELQKNLNAHGEAALHFLQLLQTNGHSLNGSEKYAADYFRYKQQKGEWYALLIPDNTQAAFRWLGEHSAGVQQWAKRQPQFERNNGQPAAPTTAPVQIRREL